MSNETQDYSKLSNPFTVALAVIGLIGVTAGFGVVMTQATAYRPDETQVLIGSVLVTVGFMSAFGSMILGGIRWALKATAPGGEHER